MRNSLQEQTQLREKWEGRMDEARQQVKQQCYRDKQSLREVLLAENEVI